MVADMPVDTTYQEVSAECIVDVAGRYDLPPELLVAIMTTEGGSVGTESRNTNGTYDYGPMQINSIWLPELKAYGITKTALRDNGCVNVAVGGWILRKNIDRYPDNIWRGIGAYHSRTDKHNTRYRNKVLEVLKNLPLLSKVLERANTGLSNGRG